MIPKDASFWNRYAKLYDGFMRKDLPAFDDITVRIAHRLQPRDRVLEAATGTGILALGLAKSGARIDAVDFAPNMIATAHRKALAQGIDNVCFSVQDAAALPFASESYDVVIIANALHIMPEPEKVLAELRRVLKADGVLIAPTFVHAQNAKAAVLSRVMGLIGFHAYHRWTQATFHQFLFQNGFAVCEATLIQASFPIDYAVLTKATSPSGLSTVSDTLYVPLMGRIQTSRKHPEILYDPAALSVYDRLPQSVRDMPGQTEYTTLASAVRSVNMDRWIRAFLRAHPSGTVVNVGCGLETLYQRNDNGKALWFELDLPEVLSLRRTYFPQETRERYLPFSMFDERWPEAVRRASRGPVLVVAAGLFHYFTEQQVIGFIRSLSGLPRAELIFDTVSPFGLRLTRRKMKRMDRQDAEMNFCVRDPKAFARHISKETVLMESRAFYRCLPRTVRLRPSTRISVRVSDWFAMVKLIHLKIGLSEGSKTT